MNNLLSTAIFHAGKGQTVTVTDVPVLQCEDEGYPGCPTISVLIDQSINYAQVALNDDPGSNHTEMSVSVTMD